MVATSRQKLYFAAPVKIDDDENIAARHARLAHYTRRRRGLYDVLGAAVISR